jgi:hypothetical protein
MGNDRQKNQRDEQTPSGYPQHSPGGARPRGPDTTWGNEPPPADAKDVHHGPPASGEEDLPGQGNEISSNLAPMRNLAIKSKTYIRRARTRGKEIPIGAEAPEEF